MTIGTIFEPSSAYGEMWIFCWTKQCYSKLCAPRVE